MTTATLDDFLLKHAPAEPQPVHPTLLKARDSVRQALAELSDVPDAALEKEWRWRGAALDVRYGLYRQYEAFEDARARVREALSGSVGTQSPARPLVGSATAARWDLLGLIAPITDADLDRDPANGEWTLRQTLAHIVNGQRAYSWFTAWWLSRADAFGDDFPARVPEDVAAELPDEATDGVGSLQDISVRFDDIVDLSAGTLGNLSEDQLAARARWSGLPVDVRFRVNRWSSHIREHTIQVEKTLGFINRPTTEVDRLLRLIAAAYGRLEDEVFMLPESPALADALRLVESSSASAARDAVMVRAAAG
jgi:uncharacterized damage-inducible protein DinB